MRTTIATPHLTFRARRLRSKFSEQVACDNQLARDVAQPLFDAGILIAAITERADYDSGCLAAGPRSYHDLRILLQGALRVEMGGQTYEMAPGDLLVCPARVPFRCRTGDIRAWWLYFLINDLPDWDPFKKHGGYVRACESAALLFFLLRDILDAKASHQLTMIARARENARALAGLLRVEMTRGAPEPSKHAAALQNLVDALIAAPQDNWDLRTMAARLHVSVSQLRLLFLEEFGVAPGQLVIRQRMRHATDQLANTHRKVADIAGELGYESLHSFTRLFTRHVGMPPGQYRARFAPTAQPPDRAAG